LLFKLFHISADPTQCIQDVGRTDVKFAEFAADVAAKRFVPQGAEDLSLALSALATSAVGCGANATALQVELRALAAAARYSKFTGDAYHDVEDLAAAIKNGSSTAVAQALNSLLADWSTVTEGCASGSKGCKFLTGLLKLLGVVAADVAPCEAALEPALKEFDAAAAAIASKNYTEAVGQFSTGLDAVAIAIKGDSCGLKKVADAISAVVPALKAAIVKVEESGAVKILVGSADVYDILYHAIIDMRNGDLDNFGLEVGMLLSKLRASQCKTPACDVLEGLLASMQLAAQDYGACTEQLDPAFQALEAAVQELTEEHWQAGAQDLGKAVVGFARAVSSCGLTDFAQIAENLATQLNATGVATEIGSIVQVLVKGADVTLDLQKLVADSHAKDWNAIGQDLGVLASWLNSTHCSSFVCKLVEGLLDGAAIPFQSLDACAGELRGAEADFTAGAAQFASHKYEPALTFWASGLDKVAKSVSDCHLSDELEYVYHEAHVLGFGDVKFLDKAAQILIHGADVYDELYQGLRAMQSKDYRTAGADIGKVMEQLSQWTKGHACTNPFCYVVLGIFEFLGDIQNDIRNCESDFKSAFGNFSGAYKELYDGNRSSHNSDFAFLLAPEQNYSNIKAGVRDIGYGLLDVAKGTKDCHLDDLAAIISKLAIKLGVVPEVAWLEEALHILIEGVQIENEVGTACLDYADGNWVGFGYNIAKLVKTLLGDDALLKVRSERMVYI
jgi:hypothetical protein